MSESSTHPSGIYIVDKPRFVSSTHVVRVVKRRLTNAGVAKSVKVGHAGTLDPLATGVIVVLVGKATKLCDRVMASRKEYVADVDLSRASTTDDEEGEITEISLLRAPDRDEVAAACSKFVGVIQQRPPAHSAVWVDGQRAYDLARKGRSLNLAARDVRIDAIEIMRYEFPIVSLRVACGKGVYIRSLARDLGETLGGGGMLTSLRRTAVGPFRIEQARHLDEVPDPLPVSLLLPNSMVEEGE